MTEAREPTEDEIIDFMDWLIDHKLPDEQIDMSKVVVMSEPMEHFSEEKFGPPSGTGTVSSSETEGGTMDCCWWDGQLYVVDLGDVRLVYNLM